jgi:hypothetical protein
MMSERAQEVAKNTGAGVYWMDAAAATAQIQSDIATTARIDKMLSE